MQTPGEALRYGQDVSWHSVTVGDVIGNVETDEAGQIVEMRGGQAQVAVVDATLLAVIGAVVADGSDTRWWALSDAFYVTSARAFGELQQRRAALAG